MDPVPFICGGLASMTAETSTFWIDTSKVRLQIQGQVIEESLRKTKYNGMCHVITKVSQEEGFLALYNGIKPALLRQGTYGTINIGLYNGFKSILSFDTSKENLGTNILCGMLAGAISSSICNPTDVLKVRLQAHTIETTKETMTMCAAFKNIWQIEGFRGLYRGVWPTAQRATIITSVALPAYDSSKKMLIDLDCMNNTEITHFVSSLVAGVSMATASTPIDTMKTRMMNQITVPANSKANSKLYKGTLDCLLRTVKSEGLLALYKGYIPTLFRTIPFNIVFFMTYEQYKRLANKIVGTDLMYYT